MGLIKVVKRPILCQVFIISTPEAVMANPMRVINTSRLGMGVLVGAILALSGCKPQAKEAAPTAAVPATGNQIAINLPNPAPNTLPVPPNPPGNLPIVPLKALEPIQTGPGRLSQPLKTSTRDPFSAVLPNQLEQPLQSIAPKRIITNKAKAILQPKVKPTKIAAAPVKPKQAIQPKIIKPTKPQPPATISVMPQVNVAPIPAPPAIMPAPIAIAPAPAMPPVVSLVDQVEITGVAQVGNQLLVVARGPGESSARTLAPGSYLSSGRILVKAVRQEGKDPVVVLVENGVETVRSVSGARAMSMR
jgi:hypothetical protein